MARLGKLLDAARRVQEATNDSNLRKRYATYPRLPQLRTNQRGSASEEHEHPKDDPAPIANIMDDTRQEARQAKSAAQRWIRDPNNLNTYIKLVQARDTAVDSIAEIDLNPYVLTEYEVGDYVRRYPATKVGEANPNKYGSWWRGPYLVTAVTKVSMVYGFEKLWYTIQNLVTIRNTSPI